MGRVNIVGILIGAIGILLVYLGVTGRYVVFGGVFKSSSSSSSSSLNLPTTPGASDIPSSNTAIPGFRFNTLNQNPVPSVGNIPNSITPQQQNVLQQLWSELIHSGNL